MIRSRFSEEQMLGILKQVVAGIRVAGLCRQYGISDVTFYKWRTKFGTMRVTDAKRLRQIEEENSCLKKLVTNLSLDLSVLKDGCQYF